LPDVSERVDLESIYDARIQDFQYDRTLAGKGPDDISAELLKVARILQ